MPFKKDEKTFILITGASKGFGRAVASSFARVLGDGSHFLLTGRDESGLEATEKAILSREVSAGESQSPRFTVTSTSLDLADAGAEDFRELFRGHSSPAERFRQMIVVHNAGGTRRGMFTLDHSIRKL